MSDQSPWGTPPPSYGVPAPQGPPPKRRRTGLALGVVGALVLAAVAFGVTLLVVGGDEPDVASSTVSSTPTAAEPPTEPTTEPATQPNDEPSASQDSPEPARGDVVTGDGYTYELPAAGWQDATAEAAELAVTIDTAIILGSSIDLSQSSIIVEALSAGAATSLEDLESLWKRNLSSSDNATPVDIEDTTIAGERAIGVRIEDRVNTSGVAITQVAYLTLHEGRQYSVGLSFPQEGDEVSEADFATMLASWTWTS